MNNQKILIVTSEFPPQPGGIGNHAYNLACHLSQRQFDVQVIADNRSKTGYDETEFDKNLPFSVQRVKVNKWRIIMYLKRVLFTFKSFNKATHVIASGKFSLWNVAFCSLFFKSQSLAIAHGSEVNFKGTLKRKVTDSALKCFDKIVAVSNYTKNLMVHLKREIVVIPNGIDFNKWAITDDFQIQLKGQPILITVGRVSTRKGQLQVIKHLSGILSQFPELHYHCVGIPTEAEDFKQIAKELGVESHITFHGIVSHNNLKHLLSLSDIFIMLSSESVTGDVEGFGIAILEANSLGIPAIGSKNCGIEDAISLNKSGVLIDPENLNAFIDGINKILKEKEVFKKEAKNWAKSHDWSLVIEHYIDLLQ